MDSIGKDFKAVSHRQNVEREFYNSFRRFLLMNQLVAAAPIRIQFTKELHRQRSIDKLLSTLHLFYGFCISASVCVATYLQHEHFDSTMGFMTSILYMGEYIIGTFNLLLVIVGCQYQKKFYAIIFKRLVTVDVNLQKCGIQPNFKTTKIYLRRSMIAYSIFFTFVIIVDLMYNRLLLDSFVRSSTVYTVPNVVSTLALTQYSMLLHYIRDKLRIINAILRRMINPEQLDSVNHKLSIISVLSLSRGRKPTEKILNILRRQHAELCRLMELLNECFGVLIVLILIAAYVILSIQFYAFYKMTEGFEDRDFWLIIYTILWVILHGGKVLLILYPVNDVIDERKRTGMLLYEMDFSNHSTDNANVIKAIEVFANQLLQETVPLNALRVINLDLTIIGTMLGVLTTYLIILIQFDAATRDNTKLLGNLTNSSVGNGSVVAGNL